MVVLVVYAIYVLPGKSKRHAPVAAHRHGPRAFSGATELVKIQAGQVHIARAGRGVQSAQDEAETFSGVRLNSRLGYTAGSQSALELRAVYPDQRRFRDHLATKRVRLATRYHGPI